MSIVARLVGRPSFWALALGGLFVVPLVRTLAHKPPPLLPVLGAAPPFVLRREDGSPFSGRELDGQVWVAALFDGHDATPAQKAMLVTAQHTRELGGTFRLVSLGGASSAMAEMADYARRRGTNPRRWAFLSGPDELLGKVRSTLGLAAPFAPETAKGDGDGRGRLVLVDTHGRIRARYDFTPLKAGELYARSSLAKDVPKETLDQLLFDAGRLVNDDRVAP